MILMKPTHIIIHHTWSKDHPGKLDWDFITLYHKSWRYKGNIISSEKAVDLAGQGEYVEPPWDDNGYHYGIEKYDSRYLIVRGRSTELKGAHCLGMNAKSIGVGIVGNFDEEEPEEQVYDRAAILSCFLLSKFPTIKKANIEPHSKYSRKTCPGRLFDMSLLQYYIDMYESPKN